MALIQVGEILKCSTTINHSRSSLTSSSKSSHQSSSSSSSKSSPQSSSSPPAQSALQVQEALRRRGPRIRLRRCLHILSARNILADAFHASPSWSSCWLLSLHSLATCQCRQGGRYFMTVRPSSQPIGQVITSLALQIWLWSHETRYRSMCGRNDASLYVLNPSKSQLLLVQSGLLR